MSFQLDIRRHLAEYKRTRIGVLASGQFVRNGRPYEHILPKELFELNLLDPIRTDALAYINEHRIRLHRDFHHLNSSQALCFNLFFPFAFGPPDSSRPLLSALGFDVSEISTAAFEHIEVRGEGTNFDFAATLSTGECILIEVKYTETEFGTCESSPQGRQQADGGTCLQMNLLIHRDVVRIAREDLGRWVLSISHDSA